MTGAAPRPPAEPRIERAHPPTAGWEVADDDLVTGLELADVDLSGRELELVDVQGCRLSRTRVGGSRWYRGGWRDVEVADSDLSTATFVDSGWTRVSLRSSRATGLSLAGAVLEDLDVSASTLDLGNLRQARLRRCRFSHCSLAELDLGAAELRDVLLEDCDLTGAQLSQARMRDVTLRRCRLEGVHGVTGLAGAVIEPLEVTELTQQLAAALGIRLVL